MLSKFRRRRRPSVIVSGLVLPHPPAEDDNFLFGAIEPHKGTTMTMTLPTDPLDLAAIYNGIRPTRNGEVRPHVTFDTEAAEARMTQVTQPVGLRQGIIAAKVEKN